MDEKKFLENFAKILGAGAQEELDKIEQKRLREEKLLKSFSAALSKTADFEVKLEEDIPQPKEVKLPDQIFKKLPTPEIIEAPTIPVEAFIESESNISDEANTIISEITTDVKPEETANIVSQATSITKAEDGKKTEAEIINASLRKEIEQIKKSVADFHKLLQQQSQKIVLAGGSHGGGEVRLERLDDVDYNTVRNATDGQVLTWNEALLKWKASDPTGGGGGGARGYTGSAGPIGYTGSTGFVGSVGIGYAGSKGSTGFVGSKGSDGYIGADGYTGSQGELGYTGSAGYIGVDGYVGSQGDLGYTGSAGYIGVNGYTGSQGDVGPIGYTGSSGTAAFGDYGTAGQILVSNGTAANWKSKFYVGNSSVIPLNPLYGDIWFSTDDNKPYMWINTGTYDTWYDFLPV